MNVLLRSASAALLLAAALAASARPITYTISATGSGTFDGKSFANALITLTATGDTSAVTGGGGLYQDTVTATATVAGLYTDTLTDRLQVFSNQAFTVGGLSDGALGDVLDDVNAAFTTYDLRSPVGPLVGGSEFSPVAKPTTNGSLLITSAGDATFTAAYSNPVPEPSALAALGLGALAVLRRRKRA